jgi:hypothetical protein
VVLDPVGTLILVVEASVALAGFSGVVVALGDRAVGDWSKYERTRLTNLLTASFVALFLSLGAIALLHAGVSDSLTWRLASLSWSPIAQGAALVAVRRFLRTPETEPGRPGRTVFLIIQISVSAVVLLQLFNAVVLAEFWPFLVALIETFGLACYSFVRLLTVPRSQ